MFAALEAQGRLGDTEIGRIDRGSLVLPVPFTQIESFSKFQQPLEKLFSAAKLDLASFTVTSENTDYSISDNTAVNAHLTNGEIVIPAKILNASDKLLPAFEQLYSAAQVDINQYIVGNEANNINPETGLPEFGWFSSFVSTFTDIVSDAWDTVTDTLDDVVDTIGDVFDGVGDFVGQVGESIIDIAASPIGQIALHMIPITAPYADYITAAIKVVNGEDLTPMDFVSLGIDSMADFDYGIDVPDEVIEAIDVGTQIANGGDPLNVLIGTYGDDFLEVTGLGDQIQTTVQNIVGEQGTEFITNYMDTDQAVADLVSGQSPLQILSNQFGDEFVNYIASDDPALQAMGYGGIETAIALDNGVDADQALLLGVKEYYDRGGRFEGLTDFVGNTGLDINITTPDWLSTLWNNVPDFELPEGFNWQGLGASIPDIQFNFPDIDLGSLDWEGLDFSVFNDFSLPELQEMNVDVSGLNLPEISLALQASQQPSSYRPYKPNIDDEPDLLSQKRSTDNELTNNEMPLSQALLQRTFSLG